MIVFRFLACVGVGLVGHQTSQIIDGLQYPDDSVPPVGVAWYRILRYAIGGVMLGIGQLIMLGSKRDAEHIIASYFTGAVGIGAGVALGYWLDEESPA